MMWWGDGWMMGWGWLFGGLIMVGVVLVVIALAALLGRPREGGAPPSAADRTAGPGAQQILDERYARGEIDTDEYQERSKGLGRS
ncbi:MAG: SHOCT domain-containing protein [Actinomycetes bacterium]